MFTAVLFDCDGVLVDSEALSLRALYRSAQQLELNLSKQAIEERFTGHSWPDALSILQEMYGRPIPNLEAFIADNRQYSERLMRTELKAMPGVVQVLENMTLPYAVVTNSEADDLQVKLEVTGLARFFPPELRFDTETMGVAKPDPAIYRRSAQAMELDIEQCLVIEDSFPGLTAATKAGATVWAYRPQVSAEQLQEFGVRHSFYHWADFSFKP